MKVVIEHKHNKHEIAFFDTDGRIGKGARFNDALKANDFVKRVLTKHFDTYTEKRARAISSFFASCRRSWSADNTEIEFFIACDYQVKSYKNAKNDTFFRVFKTQAHFITFTEVAFNYYFTKI